MDINDQSNVCFYDYQLNSQQSMKQIDMDALNIKILDQQTVIIKAVEATEIDNSISSQANELIQNEMPGHYGMIINRKHDYSIVPIDVYNNLNKCENLKAIAIVLHNKNNFLPHSTEQRLFNGKLEFFSTINEAHSWITSVVTLQNKPQH